MSAWLRLFRVQNLVTVPGDVLVGATACGGLVAANASRLTLLCAASVWLAYVAGVTKFSERETVDPTNRKKVAALVYGLLGLQAVGIAVGLLLSR